MDNISHALAGLAAAELLHRCLPAETEPDLQRRRHRLFLTSGALAGNLPDLDLVLTPLLAEPLGYLLHHRGHTHTIAYAIPQGIALWGLLWLFWPAARRLLHVSRTSSYGLAFVITAGLALHLGMDFLNSYGVHPFHPIDPRWFYGDMVFIIEPAFWIALGVPLITLIPVAWLRASLLGIVAAILAYFAAGGYLHWVSLVVLYGVGVVLVLLHLFVKRGVPQGTAGLLAGALVLMLFLGGQYVATDAAAVKLGKALAQFDPASRVLDTARTGYPANPLCWNFVSIEANEQADQYRVRRGVLAVAPDLIPVESCPPVLAERPGQHRIDASLALLTEHSGSLAELRALLRDNCFFEAWMRFARAPQVENGVATDLRFSSSPRGNFTTIDLSAFEGQSCPRGVPRWAFPRADLLSERD